MTAPGQLARKAGRSAIAIGLRQLLVQGLNILVSILLARWLVPADYAIYVLSTFVLGFFMVFGDVGLAARLIQQEEPPTERQYASVFAVQQLMIFLMVLLVFFLSPVLANLYELNDDGIVLFRLYAVAGLLLSFQVISVVKMERNLEFNRIAIIDIISNLIYNAILIVSFYKISNIVFFGIALVARSFVSCVLAYSMNPWRISFQWDKNYLKEAVKFGLPYQGINIISVVKDSFNPIIIGVLLGKTQYGLISWAQTLAAYPVWLIMILQRIYLPFFSRLRSFPEEMKVAVNLIVIVSNFIIAPIGVFTLIYSPSLVHHIFGDKWLPGLPVFYWLWLATLFVPTVTPLLGLMNAFGKSKTVLLFSVIWMMGNWVLAWVMIEIWGIMGYGYANFFVQLSNIGVFWYANKLVPLNCWLQVAKIWIVVSLVGFLVWINDFNIVSLNMLLVSFLLFVSICWLISFILMRHMVKDVRRLFKYKEV